MNRPIQLKKQTSLIVIALLLAPKAFGVVPAPDGGYPGGNTAEGQNALFSLTTGGFNTAVGYLSLRSVTTGSFNTAVGVGTLLANTADGNTATGAAALLNNTGGRYNTANGALALFSNTGGATEANTATGYGALYDNTTGGHNTANGAGALGNNTTGDLNTAIGGSALLNNTTGSYNTALGYFAGLGILMGDNNVYIAATAANVESNTIRIGNSDAIGCYIGGIFGATVFNSAAVSVDPNGKLGTITSSIRFKDNIKPTEQASEALFALKPVTFRYKKEIEPTGKSHFGLVAEDVEKVNPDLIVRDEEGKPYSVRYDQINATLLNEFLKEHRRVQQQEATIEQLRSNAAKQEATTSELKKGMDLLRAELKEQAAQIQTVTAQFDLPKPPAIILANTQ
jgi:hypothetical protein